MTPDPHRTLRRYPCPAIMLTRQGHGGDAISGLDNKVLLATWWETRLLETNEARLYDGSLKSALKFEIATGQTP